jgi:hypothetical protein
VQTKLRPAKSFNFVVRVTPKKKKDFRALKDFAETRPQICFLTAHVVCLQNQQQALAGR